MMRSSPWLHFFQNLATLTLGELLSRAAMAVTFIYLARMMEPETYGYIELAIAVNMFASLVVDMGLGTLGTREVARNSRDTNALVSQIVSLQLVVAVALVIVVTAVLLLLPLNATLKTILLGYNFCLLGYPLIVSWFFQAQGRMVWVIVPQIVRQTIFTAFVLLVLRRPEQAVLLPVAEFAAIGTAAAISIAIFRRDGNRLALDLDFKSKRYLIEEAAPIGGSQMIWVLRMYLPTILLAAIAGNSAVGYYSVSHRIVMTFQTLLEVYFRTLLPFMSKITATAHHRLQQLLRRSMLLVLIPCLALAALITTTAQDFMALLYGEAYLIPEATTVLSILIWLLPVLAWRRHARNALIILDGQHEELFSSLIGFGLLLSLIFPFTAAYGVVGTAGAMVISEFVPSALAWWYVRRSMKTPKWGTATPS